MENMNLFKKYKSRLVAEGILKSAICGLVVGFAANFVTALVCWLCGFDAGLWLSIGLGVGAAVISGVVFYFVKFKPDEKDVARRVDALGLEERMITMLELGGDDSYIAKRQREDAAVHAASVGSGLIKFQVSGAMIATACVTAACGVAMTTVFGLTIGGVLPSVVEVTENPVYVSVSYQVEGGGMIEGDSEYVFELGENPDPVMAVPDDGWMFMGWDDGLSDPYREDTDITEDTIFTAIFESVNDTSGGDGSGEGGDPSDAEGGDDAKDKPSSESNGDGGDSEAQEGNGGEQGGTGDGGEEGSKKPSEGGTGGGAGGKYEQSNQIIDGKTYYRDKLDEYYREKALEELANSEDLSPEEKALIEKYFNGL